MEEELGRSPRQERGSFWMRPREFTRALNARYSCKRIFSRRCRIAGFQREATRLRFALFCYSWREGIRRRSLNSLEITNEHSYLRTFVHSHLRPPRTLPERFYVTRPLLS